MNIYQDLEDALYAYASALFPTLASSGRIIFPFQNGPEPLTPYLLLNVRSLDAVGREQSSHFVSVDELLNGSSTTLQHYLANVRFEFVGKYDNNTTLADLAQTMEMNLRTPRGYELQRANKLSLFRYQPIERVRLKRETDMYMYYQLDVEFGFSAPHIYEQDWIEGVKVVRGVYKDANNPPDYEMITTLDIPETVVP
jgi:hypothetical protein